LNVSWIDERIIWFVECQDGLIVYIYKPEMVGDDIKRETSERSALIFEE
jgi:hypothetical protein